ncbi:MAG: trigger factor [Ekhidna sp.]
MDIKFDKSGKTEGVIKISVKRADFQPGVDQKIKQYSKTADIKGFRKGKVPTGMIKKMYGQSLIVDEINKLVSEKLNSFLRESDTQFLGEPMPESTDKVFDWDNDEQFDFGYEIGFAEPFEIKADKKVKLEKYEIKVDDQVLDETIENLQRQFGETENPDVSAENDILYGAVKSKDGSIDQEISIDLKDVEKSTLKKLIGIKLETEVELDPKKSFKHDNVLKSQLRIDDDELKKIKGKLNFTLKAVNHHILAPVDQELFDKTFGKDSVKDETEFRLKVKEAVSKNYESESVNFFEHQLREKLSDSAKINLPDNFLKSWLLKTNDKINQDMIDMEYGMYSKELKWSLVRNKIVKDQDIKVENEDVVNEAKELIKKQFMGSGLGDQMNDQMDTFAQNYLQAENGENYMKVFNQVQNQRVLDYIKGEVTVKDKVVSLDDFRKL